MTSELRSKITVKSWSSTKDAGGGITKSVVSSYDIRAKVENRTGTAQRQDQAIWNYDYKITVRYEASRVIKSNMTVDYNGKSLKINSVSYEDEGKLKYCILRCTIIDV